MAYLIITLIINRLQRIQNSAARIVTNTRKYDQITPILQKLHWLPVRQRIHFKIMLITLESYPQNSGHPVRYYYRCQCLGSSHMVIVRLVLQPPICGISCGIY